jgi:hypothetical protein
MPQALVTNDAGLAKENLEKASLVTGCDQKLLSGLWDNVLVVPFTAFMVKAPGYDSAAAD